METTYISDLEIDIDWLSSVIEERIKNKNFDFSNYFLPELSGKSLYSVFISQNELTREERIMLILTLVPNIYNFFLHECFHKNYVSIHHETHFVECPKYYAGIVKTSTSESYLPTGQTLLYLIAGNDLAKRADVITGIYEKKYYLTNENIVLPVSNNEFDPLLSNILIMKQQYVVSFITNNYKHIKTLYNHEEFKEQ